MALMFNLHLNMYEVGEFALLGPELVYAATEKVWLTRERLKTSFSQQKSYADNSKRDLELEVANCVYLKISPMKVVMRFSKKEKLSPCYAGSYKIMNSIWSVAYKLKIPNELAIIHPLFHIFMLKKCIDDMISILPVESLRLKEDLYF